MHTRRSRGKKTQFLIWKYPIRLLTEIFLAKKTSANSLDLEISNRVGCHFST